MNLNYSQYSVLISSQYYVDTLLNTCRIAMTAQNISWEHPCLLFSLYESPGYISGHNIFLEFVLNPWS
ncbi:Fimbrin [Fusarium oxysporum f. sp. albedinis]|nr:Fimbrin [Fusarium oxysporum f. sp. albedinis]